MTSTTSAQTEFRLRRPLAADLPALLMLEQRSFVTDHLSRERFRHWFQAPNATFLVCADPSNEVAGYALILYRRNSRRARLYSIVTSEQYRGRGLAQRLLNAGETAAKERDCSSLYLEVRPDNHRAIHLYQQLGYQNCGVLHAFYEDGTDALRFEKNLS